MRSFSGGWLISSFCRAPGRSLLMPKAFMDSGN